MDARAIAPRDAWIRLRSTDGLVRVDGLAEALLGHQVDDGASPPAGSWVEWSWDGVRLVARNDDFGSYPCYIAELAGGIALSPSIDRLHELGASRELDLDALAAFLAAGHLQGTDTIFRSIRALPPAARLTWQAGALSIGGERPRHRLAEVGREAAIEAITDLTRQAVARRIPPGRSSFAMPVSGGRDSRHLLLELIHQGHPPQRLVTTDHYPFDWGGDVPYARRLAGRLGIDHLALAPGPPVRAELRKNRLTSYASVMHAWFLPVVDALVGTTDHTYEGLPGGSIISRRNLKRTARRLARERRWDELAAWMGKKDDGVARHVPLLNGEMRRELSAERAAARIRRELDEHASDDDPALSYRFWTRTLRELTPTPYALLAPIPTVFTPLMDRDLVAFVLSLSGEVADESLHDEVIARAYPDVADVPYAPRVAPRPSRTFLRRLDRELLRLVWRKSDGRLVDRQALLARAAAGMLAGDGWFAWGRRFSLATYLVQLEGLLRGEEVGVEAGTDRVARD